MCMVKTLLKIPGCLRILAGVHLAAIRSYTASKNNINFYQPSFNSPKASLGNLTSHRPRTQNPEPRTQNSEPRTRNPELGTQNSEPRTTSVKASGRRSTS